MRRRLQRTMAWMGVCLLLGGFAGMVYSLRAFLRPGQPPVHALPAQSPAQPARFLGRLWMPVVMASTVDRSAVDRPAGGAAAALPTGFVPDEGEFTSLVRAGEKVVLRIAVPPVLESGKQVKIAVVPAQSCEYGERRACLSRHRGGQVTLLTVHSGLGGEGEAFRSAVEGTGLDLAFYPVWRIRANLENLAGAAVSLRAGEEARDDLVLAGAVRVPPQGLEAYYGSPYDAVLESLAAEQEWLARVLESGRPILAFEICGWQLPGEPDAPLVSPTSASVYLGIITEP